MSNLTECKDCGHLVSKKAKVCPSCGVTKPGKARGKEAGFGAYFIASIFVAGFYIIAIDNYELMQSDSRGNSALPQYANPSPPIRKPRVYTDTEIQEAIAQSDDYERYRAAFTEAARSLLTSRRCGRYEMTQYGGFVKAQGNNKSLPVYFTYCGGSHIDNRIYLDVSTGEIFR